MKFNAFISYNKKDKKFAKKLQRRLERFTFPEAVREAMGKDEAFRLRIFRYETDLVTHDLYEGLREELDRSEYLIVVCSPFSAKSEWVGDEVDHFIKTGRANKIIPVIISGKPYTCGDDECFHDRLKEEYPKSLLGQDVRDAGDDPNFLGFVKVVAKLASMLSGVPDAFDSIWNRYRRRNIIQVSTAVIFGILILSAMAFAWQYNQSFDFPVNLKEINANANLPNIKRVKISLTSDDIEPRVQEVSGVGNVIVFKDLPGRVRGKSATLKMSGLHMLPVSVDVELGEPVIVKVERDTVECGDIRVCIVDEKYNRLKRKTVFIDGIQCETDEDGWVKLWIPFEKQCSTYTVECNGKVGKIKVPCTGTDAIMIK